MALFASSSSPSSSGSPDVLLVRFQNRTFLCKTNHNIRDGYHCILQQLSAQTHYPIDRLELSTYAEAALPFISARLVSQIRGGKGGFGTLLRGSYRKQKASVVDYGDCRNLQGQRLRNVTASASSSASNTTAASLLRLPNASSSLPAWAPLNASRLASQQVRRMERAAKMHQRDKDAAQREKDEERARRDGTIRQYVQAASDAAKAAERNLQTALQEGLELQKKKRKLQEESAREKEKKRAHVTDKEEPPPPPPPAATTPTSSIVSLSGDLQVLQQQTKLPLQITNESSNFATLGIFFNQDALVVLQQQQQQQSPNNTLVLYYEVILLTGGIVQVGWAKTGFAPCSDEGLGVGDCKYSWGYDASRQMKLHDDGTSTSGITTDEQQSYGMKAGASGKAGDVVGCLLTIAAAVAVGQQEQQGDDKRRKMSYTISFTLNGQDLGVAFVVVEDDAADGDNDADEMTIFPAVSCNPGEVVELHLQREEMKHFPPLMPLPTTTTTTTTTTPSGDDAITCSPVGQFLLMDGSSSDGASTDNIAASDAAAASENGTEDPTKSNGGMMFPPAPKSAPTPAEPSPFVSSQANNDKGSAAAAAATTPVSDPALETEKGMAPPTVPAPQLLDLSKYELALQLEALGNDRLKSALQAIGGVKVGGTLQEKAARLFSLKGLDRSDFPPKVLAKQK